MNDSDQLLKRLRSATRPAHTALESLVDSSQLLSSPNRTAYARFLLSQLHFHQLVAQHIQSGMQARGLQVLDWPACERIEALKEDLHSLGLAIEPYPYVPTPGSASFAMGMCYVSEGSNLGNQMMFRQFSQNSTFNSWGASQYLETSTAALPGRWKSFHAGLLQYLAQDYEGVEKGALAGFEAFTRIWLATASAYKKTAPKLGAAH